MYNVVFRTKTGPDKGAGSWAHFCDEADFNAKFTGDLPEWYEVVEKDVSSDRADQLCRDIEAQRPNRKEQSDVPRGV